MSALRHIFSDKDQELLEAARTGKNETIEKLLRKRQTSGTTLLPSFLKSINVNCVDREGDTPLHHAALNGHQSTVEILLRENASLNVIDSRGCSPLHLASWKGHSNICLIFLTNQSGSSIVNLQNGTGDTALHNAAQFGYSATVEVLLQNNADPSIRNLKDESPLDLGARFGRLEVVQCLLNKYPELVRSSILNHSPLHLAAACGHKQIVELLLDYGYEINTKTDNGTALHIAAVYCKTDIAKLLLERGIDCCDIDKDGLTVLQLLKLHEKTQTSYTEVIKVITEHMLMLESQKKMSATPSPEETLTDEIPVYDTLVEHVKPKPKPRTSIEVKTELTDKDISDLYAKPLKDGSGRPKHTSPLKSPTCKPPIPPRQSSISMLDEETSPVLRRISEVSNERDSADLAENSQSPPLNKSDNPSAHRRPVLPPKIRTVEERRIVSMIDLPKVPNKTGSSSLSPVGLSSANSRSLKDLNAETPVPCNGQNTESGFSYFDMSSKQMEKSQAKPTKPPRLKKSLSPTPDRHATRDTNQELEPSDAKKPSESENKGQTDYEIMSKVKSPEPSPNIDTYSISVSRSSLESETKGDKSSESTNVNAEGADGGSEYYNLLDTFERESGGFTPSCVSPPPNTSSPIESGADGANVFSVYSNVSEVEKEREDGAGASIQSERSSGGFNTKCGATLSSDAGLDSDVSSVLQNTCDISTKKDSEHVSNDKQTSESVMRHSCYDNMDSESKEGIDQSQNGDIKENSIKHDIPERVSVLKGDNCDKLICDKPSESVDVQEVTTVDKRPSSGTVKNEDREDRLSNSLSGDHVIGASGSQEENDGEIEAKIAKPPSLEFHQKRILKDSFPLTPTGYVQPPTPDFPPPSPHTAMQGIHAKISVIDNKRTSQDMETITDANMMKDSISSDIPSAEEKDIPTSEDVANGNSSSDNIPTEVSDKVEVKVEEVKDEGEEEVVVMRRSSKRESMSSIDDVVSDDSLGPFAGLLRGSVIHTPRKAVSQISENVGYQHSRPTNRKSLPTTGLAFDTVKEEDTDIDKVMATIAMAKQDKQLTGGGQEHDSQFDDSEEWAKIENIMASFGGGITRESVFVRELEPNFTKQLAKDTAQIQSIGDWLERIDLGQYENTLIANGFDDTDFLSEAIMDENDLETIGITSPEHRKKILDAAKGLPQIQPIDPDNPPSSVEEWLSSLHLLDIKDTFTSHKYETMDRVLKLWELELTSVLDISAIGHRKRILASLKNRPPPDKRFPSLKRRTKDPADENTPFKDVNLYKDYTNVKPLASSEEDVKEPTPAPPVDSSEEEEVFSKDSQGKAIRDSTIHLRPPHLAHTTSPIRQWRHRPEMLIKGCCNYTAQYLGSTLVKELIGTESTIEGIAKLKKSADLIAKIPTIMLSISYKGVKFIDAKSKKVICDHEIGNIFCACQDAENMNFFAYITRDNQTGKHYCHVFSVRVADLAREIILTLGEAFEVAYQMALKERAGSEATEFERKLSQSDHEETTSISSKASVNTV